MPACLSAGPWRIWGNSTNLFYKMQPAEKPNMGYYYWQITQASLHPTARLVSHAETGTCVLITIQIHSFVPAECDRTLLVNETAAAALQSRCTNQDSSWEEVSFTLFNVLLHLWPVKSRCCRRTAAILEIMAVTCSTLSYFFLIFHLSCFFSSSSLNTDWQSTKKPKSVPLCWERKQLKWSLVPSKVFTTWTSQHSSCQRMLSSSLPCPERGWLMFRAAARQRAQLRVRS